MILRDSVHINAPAQIVWKHVSNPEEMPSWNPKVKRVTAIGSPGQGFIYSILYEMNGKASEFRAEFSVYDQPRKLVIVLTSPAVPDVTSVEEIYELGEQSEGTTILTQRIIVHHAKPRIFLSLLVYLITHFGKPTGKRYLETLKQLIENDGFNNQVDSIVRERISN